jgi:ATP-dependent Clp protease ATP-binding subunit ClpA
MRRGHDHIGPEHLLMGVVRSGRVGDFLKGLDVDAARLMELLEESLPVVEPEARATGPVPPTARMKFSLESGARAAAAAGEEMTALHVLVGLMEAAGSQLGEITAPVGLTRTRVSGAVRGPHVEGDHPEQGA